MERTMTAWTPDPANPLWWNDYTSPAQRSYPQPGTRWRHWKLGEVVIVSNVDAQYDLEALDEVGAYLANVPDAVLRIVKLRSLVEQLDDGICPVHRVLGAGDQWVSIPTLGCATCR